MEKASWPVTKKMRISTYEEATAAIIEGGGAGDPFRYFNAYGISGEVVLELAEDMGKELGIDPAKVMTVLECGLKLAPRPE